MTRTWTDSLRRGRTATDRSAVQTGVLIRRARRSMRAIDGTIARRVGGLLGSVQSPAGKETKMRSTPVYEVHAVKYAHLPRKAWEVQITPDPHDADYPMDYFVWVALPLDREGKREIGGKPIVIDTGFNAQVGKKRGREVKRNPADLLADFGVDPAEVEDVVKIGRAHV